PLWLKNAIRRSLKLERRADREGPRRGNAPRRDRPVRLRGDRHEIILVEQVAHIELHAPGDPVVEDSPAVTDPGIQLELDWPHVRTGDIDAFVTRCRIDEDGKPDAHPILPA